MTAGRPPRRPQSESTTMDTRSDLRDDLRAPVREDDPRARAAARAALIMGDVDAMEDQPDSFHVDPDMIPDGWTYEWKRHTVYNKEDPAYQVQLSRTGWEPVPADRHPEMMPKGWKGETIDREGQILMERPAVITQKIQERDRLRARDQIRIGEAGLNEAPKVNGSPTFERVDGRKTPTTKIKRSYEPIEVPED